MTVHMFPVMPRIEQQSTATEDEQPSLEAIRACLEYLAREARAGGHDDIATLIGLAEYAASEHLGEA